MQSALTGHLVFSTLHTNDALSSISRLKDLGIETSILSEALAGVISQRLVRKLCSDCKERIKTDLTPIEDGFLKAAKVKPGYRAVGCESCNFSGYSGRMVITEMFEIDSQLRSLILSGETDIKKLSEALGDHKQNLAVSASRLIISGETSVEEVVRVIGRHFWIDVSEEYKTELPSLSVLSNTGEQLKANARIPILLVGPEESFTETFKASLNHAWISILTASSPEESKKALKDNEEIKFVIVDVDESLDDEDILKYVSDYRVAMAWSRLPALIRLPEGRETLKEKLQAEGATSRFVLKTEPSEQIIEMINSALAENLDYSWGIEN